MIIEKKWEHSGILISRKSEGSENYFKKLRAREIGRKTTVIDLVKRLRGKNGFLIRVNGRSCKSKVRPLCVYFWEKKAILKTQNERKIFYEYNARLSCKQVYNSNIVVHFFLLRQHDFFLRNSTWILTYFCRGKLTIS